MAGELLKFGLSFLAIGAMIGLVWFLRLGSESERVEPGIALQLAQHAYSGFDEGEVLIVDEGRAALVRGSDDAIVFVKPHGSRLSAFRVLGRSEGASGTYELYLAGRRAPISLKLPKEAQGWVQPPGGRA